jgi:hypothetical protein
MHSTHRQRLRLVGAALALAFAVGGISLGRLDAATTSGPASVVVPTSPFRILDTRSGLGVGGAAGALGSSATIDLAVAGVGPVPADATGVVLNVTSNSATEPSYITAWPTGTERPEASVLNVTPGIDLPNMITAQLGDDGRLSLYNHTGSVHLIADVAGYLIPGSGTPGPQGPAGPEGSAGPEGPAGPGTLAFGTNTNTGVDSAENIQCIIGELKLFAGSRGSWLVADGRLLSISQNTSLFALIGTTFGGNGQTNFAIPDLSDAAPDGTSYYICLEGIFPGTL